MTFTLLRLFLNTRMLTHQGGQRASFQVPPLPSSVLNSPAIFTIRDRSRMKVVCVQELGEGVVDSETPVIAFSLDEEDHVYTPEFEPTRVDIERSYRF